MRAEVALIGGISNYQYGSVLSVLLIVDRPLALRAPKPACRKICGQDVLVAAAPRRDSPVHLFYFHMFGDSRRLRNSISPRPNNPAVARHAELGVGAGFGPAGIVVGVPGVVSNLMPLYLLGEAWIYGTETAESLKTNPCDFSQLPEISNVYCTL